MIILKLSLTGIVASRASHRVLSAEPLVLTYGVERAHDSRYLNLCDVQANVFVRMLEKKLF